MSTDRWERYGAATGILFVVLLAVGFLITPEPPDVDASAQEVSQYYVDEQDGIRVSLLIISTALLFLVWFLGTLRGVLRAAEGGTGRLSGILFGGGLIFIASVVVGLTGSATAAFRPEETSPQLTRAISDFGLLAFSIASFAVVAFFLAAAVVTLRTSALPAPLGWLALLAAAANALAIGNIFTDSGAFAADGVLGFVVGFVLFLAWILATSILLARRLGGSPTGGPVARA